MSAAPRTATRRQVRFVVEKVARSKAVAGLPDLAEHIYTAHYLRGEPSARRDDDSPEPGSRAESSLQPQLSEANATADDYETGWVVDLVERDGIVTAVRGNARRVIHPGDYVTEEAMQGVPEVGTVLALRTRRESRPRGGQFYYAMGQEDWSAVADDGVRIYFDARPDRAAGLLRIVSSRLNELHVPYVVKCLVEPDAYRRRCDNFILYVDRIRANFALTVVAAMHDDIAPCLAGRSPLFGLRLAPGVAFAENPPDPRESFGMSRSKVLAVEIVDLVAGGVDPDAWSEEIEGRLEHRGFDLDRFYLNPGSRWQYDLPAQQLAP